MIGRWWRHLFGHEREPPPDDPLRRSRELTTESNLRAVNGEQLLRRIERERQMDIADILAEVRPPWEHKKP